MHRILRASVPLLSLLTLSVHSLQQSPLMAGTLVQSGVMLEDVLPRSQSIGIFSSLCNDISSVSSALGSANQNLTVLAPEDAEIKKLQRKPWEDPRDGAEAYVGEDGVDRAQKNLERFVKAHVVVASPWEEGEKVERLSGAGGKLWWENKDGKKVIQPGNIEVVQIADKVSNGEVWVIRGVLNYAI